MSAKEFDPTTLKPWRELEALAGPTADIRMREQFRTDPDRVAKYSLEAAGLYLDYSKNLVTDEVMACLLQLAEASSLAERRQAMFDGTEINTTEQRPVLHTALRADRAYLQRQGQEELAEKIARQKARMREISDKIRAGHWRGSTGKAITDVVNLGIGGSDLGPRLACEALKEYGHDRVKCHFVSNVDGEVINSALAPLDPETTLVIIASKTFTTQETLLNASTAADWFRQRLGLENPYASAHFVGVTATPENAQKLGVPQDNILRFWDWVGGRYSLWSSIGFPIAIAVGYDNFEKVLAGARKMDDHFRQTPLAKNMPVVLALLGIWYTNFLGAESHAVIPYCERLLNLPFYLQQLDMESNGKSTSLDGAPVGYATGPIIWGLTGTNGQHSFFQLLHQGTHLVPVDFIGQLSDPLSAPEHHRVLMANMFAQAAALMAGQQEADLPPYRHYPGNRPSNTLLMERLAPETLGALIALYEHKVFVQGSLWNINSFDQWGVELGKQLASQLLDSGEKSAATDPSTAALMARLGPP